MLFWARKTLASLLLTSTAQGALCSLAVLLTLSCPGREFVGGHLAISVGGFQCLRALGAMYAGRV